MGSFMGTQSEIYIIELNIKLNQEDIECVLNWFLGRRGFKQPTTAFILWKKPLRMNPLHVDTKDDENDSQRMSL